MYIFFAEKNSKINILSGKKMVKSPKNKKIAALYPCPAHPQISLQYKSCMEEGITLPIFLFYRLMAKKYCCDKKYWSEYEI